MVKLLAEAKTHDLSQNENILYRTAAIETYEYIKILVLAFLMTDTRVASTLQKDLLYHSGYIDDEYLTNKTMKEIKHPLSCNSDDESFD